MTQREYNQKSFKSEDIVRLKQLINEGCEVHQEIDDLKAGLSETVKAIAEELELKPSQLNKAIRIAHKASMSEEREKLNEIEDILDAVGKNF